MDRKLYALRALRYIIRMVILIGLIFVILHLAGMLDTGGQGFARALFLSWKGLVLIAALLLLAAIYPRANFTKEEVRADMSGDREAIINTLRSCNYVLTSETGDTMVFRAKGAVTRLISSYNDAVTVTREGEYIGIEGLKKNVSRVNLRIRTFLAR